MQGTSEAVWAMAQRRMNGVQRETRVSYHAYIRTQAAAVSQISQLQIQRQKSLHYDVGSRAEQMHI